MEEILIDSDALLALTDNNDVHHVRAIQLYKELRADFAFIVTNFTFGETLTLVSKRLSHKRSLDFADTILSETMVLDIDESLRNDAYLFFRKQVSKNVSFVDCVNMAVLKTLNQDKIFSFDEHYKKNGFKRVGIEVKV